MCFLHRGPSAPPVLGTLLLLLLPLAPRGVAAQGESRGDPVPPPAPWSLREDFDPNVIPGFAAWFQRSVDRVMEGAVADSVTPGAWVVVGHGGGVVLSRGYGRMDRGPGPGVPTDSTLWDVASVTKAVATTLAVMRLVEEERLDVDVPLHRVLPEWPSSGAPGRVRVRHLLNHTSGLPAGATPAMLRGEDGWVAAIAAMGLEAPPGRRETYSDLGPLLLGRVVEEVAGVPLDRHVEDRIYRPLGLRETGFRPLRAGVDASRVVPTDVHDGGPEPGVVHDPLARALGGVAGNAGVFASARDLADLASALLWERPARVVCRDVLRAFTAREGDGPRFGLGWEMPSRGGVWREIFGPRAFGHTGFTGTSLWVDPDRDLFVILLTSRLNAPDPGGDGHLRLRRELHDVVVRAGTGALPEVDDGTGWRSVDSCRADAGHARVSALPPWTFALIP